jgi:putative FmdB family regulatory protein
MPLYEFECEKCGWEFEELVRSASATDEVQCPACDSQEVHKKVSLFASKAAGGINYGRSSAAASSCSTGST